MEHMRNLKIGYPALDQYPSVIDVSFPRVSPELQALPATSGTPLYASVAGVDSRGWTLGKGWNNLASLKLAGLSQNGVSLIISFILTEGQDYRDSVTTARRDPCTGRTHPSRLD
jgi:hypothetical protein